MKGPTEITQKSNCKIAASTPGAREPREELGVVITQHSRAGTKRTFLGVSEKSRRLDPGAWGTCLCETTGTGRTSQGKTRSLGPCRIPVAARMRRTGGELPQRRVQFANSQPSTKKQVTGWLGAEHYYLNNGVVSQKVRTGLRE